MTDFPQQLLRNGVHLVFTVFSFIRRVQEAGIFSSIHSVFSPIIEKFHHVGHLYFVVCKFFQSFPKKQIFYSSKLKEFADDNFKFDENVRKFSKGVENTAGKGEIAHYEQFLLFPQCFQKTSTADM